MMTCTWEPDPACLTAEWDALDDDEKHRALLLATSSLQMLTYYRVGSCPITIRPCPKPKPCGCWDRNMYVPYGVTQYTPMDWNGQWYNCVNCGAKCEPLSEVVLPGPVGYIDSLVIDGQLVDLWNGDWRMDDGHKLVWQGQGPSPVPSTQDLDKPDTEVGTWSISYSKSYPVLADGRLAVAYLAMEFAKACKPKAKCSLPQGVTSVVRNGVSFTVQAGLFPSGLTGLEIVDAYILKWAPAGAPTKNATVFNPSKHRTQARVTSGVPVRGPLGSA